MTFLQLEDSVEELCVGRPSDEFFRLTTEGRHEPIRRHWMTNISQ